VCFDGSMSRRAAVNRTLSRLTGYELRKSPVRSGGSATRTTPPGGANAPAAGTKPTPPAPKPAPREEVFPKDYDDELVEIIRAVRPFTMTSHEKLHALISAVRYVSRYNVPGDIVECGVWRGGSMHAAARVLDQAGDHSRDLYLYDTFEGMTEPTDQDVRHDGRSAAELFPSAESKTSWLCATIEDVSAGFDTVPYPKERVHLIKGPVEETIPAHLPERIAVLRLDTDWYASTAHELAHMYDRLVPGGVLLIDDYGWWLGSRQATDEFLERTGEQLLLVRTGSGRVAVKR
jgi:O-methyltransferase